MVRDRLAEMQAKSAEVGESKQKKKESNGTPLLNSEEQLEECLKRVTEIDNKIKTMKDEIEQMKKLQKNIISNPLIDKKEVKKLEQTSDKVFNTSSKLQKEITEYRAEFAGMHMDNTHERMIRTHLDRLGSDVTKAMNDFRAAQLEYIEKTQKLHHRKYEIVTGNEAGGSATVDPSNIQAVFAGDYFAEAQKAKMELREIESRDMEIKKIENSVIQVNLLFKEINALVMEQGEKIDNIEKHVEEAVNYVESGNVQLTQARQSQSKARRKKICCIGVLVAILLIAGVIITIVTVSQSDSK
ncbi:syntaxin-1A-like isoform X2 [Mercenaria mercenaria]|nr:syntaxin-1A-like isoform X2 [Mercenaria mercenaria]